MDDRTEKRLYVIEREIPGAGQLTSGQRADISRASCSVLDELGPDIQWLHSYVTEDRVYCIYSSPSEDLIREHARRGGFPANRIAAVKSIMDPDTRFG